MSAPIVPHVLFLLFLVGAMAGCFGAPPNGWNWRLDNDTENDYWLRVEFGHPAPNVDHVHFPPGSQEPMNLYCGSDRGEPQWVKIGVRDPRKGDDVVGADRVGPVMYTANWTGPKCGHNYVFELKSEWDVEFYEADASWNKVRDIERVPP